MNDLCRLGTFFLLIALQAHFVNQVGGAGNSWTRHKANPVPGFPQLSSQPAAADDDDGGVDIMVTKVPVVTRPAHLDKPTTTACNWCLRPSCNPGGCKPAPNFNADADAKKLHKAMDRAGTDESVLFDILTHRSEGQIELIKQAYLSLGENSLEHDVESDTSLKVEDLLLALLKTRAEFFADELHHAFKYLKHEPMILILASLPPCAIREISSTFYKRYGVTLIKAARKGSVLKFQEFLEQLIKADRDDEGYVDEDQAMEDAAAIHTAGPESWIKKKRVFIHIFTQRSFTHLKRVKQIYDDMFKPNFETTIAEHSGGGKLTQGLLAVLRNALDQPRYFGDEVEGALQHLVHMGINDNSMVIRILRGRCGIDLGDIRNAYPKNHDKKKLVDVIKQKSFFEYETVLVQLLQ